jgi:hypothetical protein
MTDGEKFHALWSAFHSRWTMSAPCLLTGKREWMSHRAARRAARYALYALRPWYARIDGRPQSYA